MFFHDKFSGLGFLLSQLIHDLLLISVQAFEHKNEKQNRVI
jgi:hypothetical protein